MKRRLVHAALLLAVFTTAHAYQTSQEAASIHAYCQSYQDRSVCP